MCNQKNHIISSKCIDKNGLFQIGQKEIVCKDFYKQKQVADIIRVIVNKVVVSDKVSCNNRKSWWYIIGFQVDRETMIPLFIKTPKNIFSYGMSQYDKNSAYSMFLRYRSGCFTIETSGMRLRDSYMKSIQHIL